MLNNIKNTYILLSVYEGEVRECDFCTDMAEYFIQHDTNVVFLCEGHFLKFDIKDILYCLTV